jgi:DNA ligase-1
VKRFTALYRALDETTSTSRKIEAMAAYFGEAPAADAAWAVYLLIGRRPKRLLPGRDLRTWVAGETGYPLWLVEETYAAVGDLAETVALLLDEPGQAGDLDETPLATWMEERIGSLRRMDAEARRATVVGWWRSLATEARFVLNKLITGGFRVGVSRRLVVRALARHSGVEPERIAHRLMGQWAPEAAFFEALVAAEERPGDAGRPYPFFLASPLQEAPETLGPIDEWTIEWKWDGIRAQLLRREAGTWLWSRGEEALDGRFPEIEAGAAALAPGTVLDGEVVAWADGGPLPFARLQRRIGRLKPDRRVLTEAPVIFLAFDLLEDDGVDLRGRTLDERRARLAERVSAAGPSIAPSEPLAPGSWEALGALRSRDRVGRAEGFLIKRTGSPYRVGRVRGDWWKWKVDPRTLDAVLLYAEPGHGRRSSLLTDYTFGIWHGDALVPIAKAYSGLDQAEIEELDRWIRRHTRERFGPVRSVEPHHVFELACDGVQRSTRHKAGLTLRFPRIHRWRRDLRTGDADHLADAEQLVDE